jgi:hypothetical protein
MKILTTCLALLLSSPLAWSHAHLNENGSMPSLRNPNPGIKTGPCGPGARNPKPTILAPGQQLRVDWLETINHKGYFRIAFSPNADQGYDDNVLATVPDTQNMTNNLPHTFSTIITVPSTPCTNCSIQLIQYMMDIAGQPPSLYYSCADIEIRAGAAPLPSSTPPPAPKPSSKPAAHDGCE